VAAATELKAAYLIAGSDWPKVDAALARLRARFGEESVEQIAVGGDTDADVVAACNALDLLGAPRLVLVRGAGDLGPERVAAIVGYLADPTPNTCLALFGAGGIDPAGPLARAVAAVGEVRLFEAPERKRAAEWVVRRFAEAGVRCPQPVARRVVDLVGDDMGDLSVEVDKLVTFADGEPPELEDVNRLVPAAEGVKPWEITDAWGRRDPGAVIALALADIGGPGDVGRVVATVSNHVRRVCRAAAMLDEGATQADIAGALGLKPFPAQKLVAQAQRFDRRELAAAVVRLAEVDLAVKGGSRLDARFELELALAEIART
jgi:DNA polymerase III subunit delta